MTKAARFFHTKRRLGQNFLVDPEVLSRIAGALDLKQSDCVVEIGPGLGFLTRFLSPYGCRILAIDLDRECVEELQKSNFKGVEIFHQDFLQFDLNSIECESLKIVGNVPYQITTPIVARLFGEIGAPSPWLPKIDSVVMTVQKEVAERFVASPNQKEYSQITLLIKYFAHAELLESVPADSFVPEPNVNSAVVRMTPHSKTPVDCVDHKLLRQIIRAGFKQRRKMLRNNLSFLNMSPEQIGGLLASLKIDPMVRAERLSLEQFAKIANAVVALR
ncbi:MAG TPA: 16S rRNA (adenine(1518)-N(6)/adenine(1519)-N(6))-dimethyltransferase RsmA [Candidatus Melainabacteria bacterium]|nr:16S rRNA (adenine(1518)-N(6)/adenine(1519)-N(6))-dimethyltransferase RsmA [Candidatus Melainabacteria bacterium]